MYRSPLRYPGGKAKLAAFMRVLMCNIGHPVDTYIEPFAGGAGIAMDLLQNNFIKKVVINDYDKGIYSFWRAILTETERFVHDIETIPLTMDEWKQQRLICMNNIGKYSYELGFATFYMNRTNRSGIIKGGVIGGYDQTGRWKLDARFSRKKLAKRIIDIAKLKSRICLYNKDISSFIIHYLPKFDENAYSKQTLNVPHAANRSAASMMRFLSQRSAIAPATNLNRIVGANEQSVSSVTLKAVPS